MKEKKLLRILHAPGPICGQAWAVCEGLNTLGQDAKSGIVAIEGQNHNRYGYQYHTEIPIEGGWVDGTKKYISENIDNFDVIHFHSRSFFHFTPWPRFPTALDIAALRMAGKIVVFHFRGSEVRRASIQKERNPYHYVDDAPEVFQRTDEDKDWYVKYVKSMANKVFVVDREVQEYVGGATEVPICLNMNEWRYIGQVNKSEPHIVHAPTHRGIKGTEQIITAVEALKNKGLKFKFELIEGLSNDEAKLKYESCDIVVDQLRMGWFGTLTVEAMALGKPVICFLRPELLTNPDEIPIVNANPDNIQSVLEELIVNSELRNSIAVNGRQYVEKNHSHIYAAEISLAAYQDAIESSASSDPSGFIAGLLEHVGHAEEQVNEGMRDMRNRLRAQFREEMLALKRQHAQELSRANKSKNLILSVKRRIKRYLG